MLLATIIAAQAHLHAVGGDLIKPHTHSLCGATIWHTVGDCAVAIGHGDIADGRVLAIALQVGGAGVAHGGLTSDAEEGDSAEKRR